MSQFGTIGVPRLHPCTAHPSCSQFNSNDIIRTSTGKSLQYLQIPFSMDIESKYKNNEDSFNVLSSINQKETILEADSETVSATDYNFQNVEELHQRYVEVSPGVWSYVN